MADYRTPLINSEVSGEEEDSLNIQVDIGNGKIDLRLSTILGEGAFGTVYKAEDERGKYFAVKMTKCLNQQSYFGIAGEIEILTKTRHERIVSMYAVDFWNSTALIVMEYCENGNLNSRLTGKEIDLKVKLRWMVELTEGLKHLHATNIIHRDLKAENILLNSKDKIKISDFGISREFICGSNRQSNNGDNTEYLSEYLGTFAGTPFWVAPEVFDLKYDESADIFSLGAIFYSILEQRCVKVDGVNYYGLFVSHNGQDVGLGLAMFERKESIKPSFSRAKDASELGTLQNVILQMVSYEPNERSALTDIHDKLQGAFQEYLTGKPPAAEPPAAEPLDGKFKAFCKKHFLCGVCYLNGDIYNEDM